MVNTADFLVGRAPNGSIAISESGRDHTYGELRAAAAGLADRLAELGLPSSSPVGVMAPNGFFWAAAYLAVLSLGLVAVPMPLTVPKDEVAARLRWVGARAVVAGRRQHRLLSSVLPPAVPLVVEGEVPVGSTTGELLPTLDVPDGQDAVYQFTSGTTGCPRAVRLTHRNLQANTESILAFTRIAPDDRMLVVLPFTYVFGASLLHTHLRTGASLVIQPNIVFPQAVVEELVVQRCTSLAGVPSTFHLLLRNSSFGDAPIGDLRAVQQAGGRMAPAVLRELVLAQPQAEVFVMYGQTEATARLSYLAPDQVLTRIGSVGRGVPGVELRVVDEAGVPVEPGVVGEIRARGDSISPGYLHDPEATSAKMPGGELRTGDLATVDADGYLYIVDRVEDFIKSWGFRIASQDVEAAAMTLGDLTSAAAVGVPDDVAGERLALAVTKRPGSMLTTADVLDHCRRALPRHMVPAEVHILESLPLNANGKVVKGKVRDMLATSIPTGG